MDFPALASALLARSLSVCEEWFPAGRKRGREFVVGGLGGETGESLSINLESGVWSDFATGEAGGDLIALYAARERIEMGEAYRRLSNGRMPAAIAAADRKPAPQRAEIISPVPDGAPTPLLRHATHGKPSASWVYRDQQGRVLGYVARYDTPGGKQIVPWAWTTEGWQARALAAPRPLYGLDRLTLNQRVMLVEGEKDADAAQAIVGERYAVLTWSGGAQAHGKGDWQPLEGRKVLLWPDADEPGIKAMQAVAVRLAAMCPEVKILDVSGHSDGWGAADSGFDWPAFLAWARPRARLVQREAPAALPVPAPAARASAAAPLPPSPGFALWDLLGLVLGGGGAPLMNLDNVVRAVEGDSTLRGHIWYDEFLDAIETDWQGPRRTWKDADDVLLQLYMQRHVGLSRVGVQTCHDAALVAAFHDTRNECRSWLESLPWDGVDRLRHLLPEGFGAEENAYTDAVGRCWVISMVARVFRPGCKVDTVPVLEGGQGRGKSTALSILGGKWFVECHESVLTKDFYGVLQGHMLVEISEMHSFTRAEVERVKGIISCQVDRYRKAYGRNTEDHPRRTVLACTTNRDDWQRDDTGARRFWPVACGEINLDWLRLNRDQLFAEAVHLFRGGAPWWDVPQGLQQAEADARRDVDSWEDAIGAFVADRSRVSTSEVLSDCIKLEVGKHDHLAQRRVGRALRALGWQQISSRAGDGRNRRVWVNVSDHQLL